MSVGVIVGISVCVIVGVIVGAAAVEEDDMCIVGLDDDGEQFDKNSVKNSTVASSFNKFVFGKCGIRYPFSLIRSQVYI